jgi:hypothetical protein
VGFRHRTEAEAFLADLRDRLARFGLELHPDKTRLIRFGRTARTRGGPKPPTFNFLGFTHSCGKTRNGYFNVLRQTMRQRWQAKLQEVKLELRKRLHFPIPEQGVYLGAVVRGHVGYYGVPGNSQAINAFRASICRLWRRVLDRRSQRGRVTWERLSRLIARWLPPARICHPYPDLRFAATTQGRSRMR